jgi:integrase/recombinase XerD
MTNGALSSVASKGDGENDSLKAFRDWMRRHRGTGEKTILDHARE